MKKEIPIFFSTDDNYIPYLDVALRSLIENASSDYDYRIIVLNTGLSEESAKKVKPNERAGVRIDFMDISEQLASIKSRLRDVYHFSIVTYYRLFIASLFPQYDKVLYLDCDLVVLGDIARLYHTDLGDNILGAAPEQFVRSTGEFRLYAERALGVDPDAYVNAGVLLMNLAAYRRERIEDKFVQLITEHEFDLLDPDQAYLNYLCQGRICVLPSIWNQEPMQGAGDADGGIVHYALYKKPWQYDDMTYGEHFWRYAECSPFYAEICRRRENFSETDRQKKEAAAAEILEHAIRIVNSDQTFSKVLYTR